MYFKNSLIFPYKFRILLKFFRNEKKSKWLTYLKSQYQKIKMKRDEKC